MKTETKTLKTALRNLPYGIFKDLNGAVVLYNRDYEVLKIGGVKEFHFDPETLGNIFEAVYDGKFLMTEEGDSYVGKMLFLYDDCCSPIYGDRKDREDYLKRLSLVMNAIATPIGNAYNNSTATEKQYEEGNKKMDELRKMATKR